LRTAQRLKAEGVLPGVADLVLFIPTQTHHGLFIELKIKPNKQSVHQKEWQALVTKMNYHYVVVYSFDEFKEQIENYIGNT
jgi:CRISPR/Cas system-associated protein Cas5 (RAMP superfamily)